MRSSHLLVALLALAGLVGCSAASYYAEADQQVYDILDSRRPLVPGSEPMSIDVIEGRLREVLLLELAQLRQQRIAEQHEELVPGEPVTVAEVASDFGEAGREISLEERLADIEQRYAAELAPLQATDPPELPPQVLTLVDCLEIAADNSRDYQREKELVYLTALDLTLERWQFATRYSQQTSYEWFSTPQGLPDPTNRRRQGNLVSSFSFSRMLAGGGMLVFDYTSSILHRFTGITFGNGERTTTGSVLDLTFVQPLLRGGGALVAQEPLVQAERDVVYALRSFERFRQEFAVQVAREYYALLQQRDVIENNRRRYLQLISSREQSAALAGRGRQSQIQVDQALQRELAARNTWLQTIQRYQDLLDRFKITLGLPMAANIVPDAEELRQLEDEDLVPVDEGEAEAVTTALLRRLDFQNEQDRLTDRQRKVKVAENDLKAFLDLEGGYRIDSDRDTLFDLDASEASWSAGATLDLPLDRRAERNAYREAIINAAVQLRATTLLEDQIQQQIRTELRLLARLRETYTISRQSVDVAVRRVESTNRFLRMGRIQIRDALEATDDLASARNSLSAALVEYRIAQLQFYRDMGTLVVREDGLQWKDAEGGEEDA